MIAIPRKSNPINVVVHYPQTEEGRRELAQRVASAHADMVYQTIQKLNCSSEQKVQLLDSIIETYSKTTERDKDGRTR